MNEDSETYANVNNYSQINENSAICADANTHDDLALYATNKHGRINENSTPYAKINDHNLTSYLTIDHSRISEISASMHACAINNSMAFYL